MARADAVRAINPKLFDRGWSKVSGSGGIGRRAQMVRAACGHAPAIFKPIRQGGCHTGAQLRSQLAQIEAARADTVSNLGPRHPTLRIAPQAVGGCVGARREGGGVRARAGQPHHGPHGGGAPPPRGVARMAPRTPTPCGARPSRSVA